MDVSSTGGIDDGAPASSAASRSLNTPARTGVSNCVPTEQNDMGQPLALNGVRSWSLRRFEDYCDKWSKIATPTDELFEIVANWFVTRETDPYQGATKLEKSPLSLWFARIPNSHDGYGHVVACTYWIDEPHHTVHCHSFATLSMPL